MDVRDDPRGNPREPAPQHAQGRLLRTLGQDGVGTEVAKLAGHAKRKRRVERRPVERTRPDRRHEPEARIAPVPAPGPASTRTSSSAERAANFCSSEGESGRE